MIKHASLAPLLERFFIQRLMQQRQASPHTISSYRDTFRQLLKFAERTLYKPPSRLSFEEIDTPLITAFLDDLENNQGISVRSRNLRLTAIHSFFRYAAFEAPEHSAQIQRILAIPSKRFTRTLVSFLTRRKWMHCWPHRIDRHGPGGAIMRFSWSPCRPACVCRRSPVSSGMISFSEQALICASLAKGARKDVPVR